jgi:CRISPR/Cas system endoribonuclease Cas6 (RAMP superfamily)
LENVYAVHPLNGEERLVYTAQDASRLYEHDMRVRYADIIRVAGEMSPTDVTLRVLTPTRLKHAGRYVTEPQFHVLIRALLRRVSALAYFHCGKPWNADYQQIVAMAQEVELVENQTRWIENHRRSRRQRRDMSLSGLVGTVTYRGNLRPFRALLRLGSLIHVGKACVFGNGWYRVEEPS